MDIERLLGQPVSVKISTKIEETKRITTLLFDMPTPDLEIRSGQFFMIWVPGVDEIPMSVSQWEPPTAGISIQAIGEATKALVNLNEGEWLGIRGPFGSYFAADSKKALVVGGGIGMAPLRFLVSELLNHGADVTLLVAAKTQSQLLTYDFAGRIDSKLHVKIATDDGSMGSTGLATDVAEELVKSTKFDTIYTCGPELMMVGLFNLAQKENIRFQASLERYMKCGCGICGTCAMDPTGVLVCKDGPVFTSKDLAELEEFGKYSRDATGIKQNLI
jgi:dihydroorotate dehydrogenase electron transfer subunit